MQRMQIANREIDNTSPPFVIAELSGNHNGSLEQALKIVDAAAQAGVSALKIQTYTADTMTLDSRESGFVISNEKSLWHGKNLYQLYQEAYTPWEWHEPIFDRCRQHGIIGFSTPFDQSAIDFLEKLAVPCYKIASFELTDIPLLRGVARTGKPVILSTGMASVGEIDTAVQTLRRNGTPAICLLKCTSSYPASPENSNLRTLQHMGAMFDCLVGVSDHTLGVGVAIAGVALGATVIEKHFTLSRADGGVDSAFSAEPAEMKLLVEEVNKTKRALGQVSYGPTAEERESMQFRRSIYVCENLKAGDVLSDENIRIIRPGFGLAPHYYELVLGRRVVCDLGRGIPLLWEHVMK